MPGVDLVCNVVKYQIKLYKMGKPTVCNGSVKMGNPTKLPILFGSLALKGFNSLLKNPQQDCLIFIMALLLFFSIYF